MDQNAKTSQIEDCEDSFLAVIPEILPTPISAPDLISQAAE